MSGEPLSAEDLTARYGRPAHCDEAAALAVIGRKDVPPDMTYAMRYASEEGARESARSNLAHHGHPTLGIAPLERNAGRLIVLDLRPALAGLREGRAGT